MRLCQSQFYRIYMIIRIAHFTAGFILYVVGPYFLMR